jgi:ketosteroid isomerase-like protein
MEFINESAPVVNGDIALTHGKWRLTPEAGDAMEGSTAEVVRKGADGTWRYAVDNPWGSSVLDA